MPVCPRDLRGVAVARIAWWVAVLLCGSFTVGRAQISPGPLSRAHTELEGVKNCLKCHGIKEKAVDPQCLACHKEIVRLRETERGFHARDAKGECSTCHIEHGGVDFDLVGWKGDDQFDHSLAGYVLDGKHASLECVKCHRADLRISPVMALRDGKMADDTWLGLENECFSCHKDPHESRFGTTCTKCHSTADWKQITNTAFDHDKTRYPLQGKHRDVECAKCHKNGYKEMPAFQQCRDCHEDVHKGAATLAGLAVDCAQCHRLEGFLPSTYDVTRHAKAKYALEGKHASVKCAGCHRADKDKSPVVFRPAFAKCADCHADAHGGQLARRADRGKCESCHDVKAFVPSHFTVADHAAVRFPLQGAHEKVQCESCHGPKRKDLPPLPAAKVIGAAGVLLHFQTMQCVDCHADPHRRKLGETDDKCQACHDATAFSPSLVDPAAHDKYDFRLDGAHAAVPCFLCHKTMTAKHPESTLLATAASWPDFSFQEKEKACRDCHEDPHGGQFASRKAGSECNVCHGADSFRPAAKFDHERDTKFSLTGAHAKVTCVACHGEGTLPDGKRGAVYATTPRACEACHVSGTPETTGTPERGTP